MWLIQWKHEFVTTNTAVTPLTGFDMDYLKCGRCHICMYIASASLCCVCYGISRKNSVDVLWESNWNCVNSFCLHCAGSGWKIFICSMLWFFCYRGLHKSGELTVGESAAVRMDIVIGLKIFRVDSNFY